MEEKVIRLNMKILFRGIKRNQPKINYNNYALC